jgi:hypothetical protein
VNEATVARVEIAAYIRDLTNELVRMARDAGLEEVAALLYRAAMEAEMQSARSLH